MIHRVSLMTFLALVLAACSFAPIPVNVNLLEDGFPESKGEFSIETPSSQIDLLPDLTSQASGTIGPFSSPVTGIKLDIIPIANALTIDLNIPNANGFLIDFTDQDIPATLDKASLSYELELSKTGPVEANFTLQTYLAPNATDDLLQDKYKLGNEKNVDFTTASISDTLNLSDEQLRGINEKQLRLVIVITQGSLTFTGDSEASFNYEITKLELNIAEVTANIRQLVPSEEGIAFDFGKAEIPSNGRIVNLGVDYGIQLDLIGELEGDLQSQVYLAPATVENIIQDQYALGTPQTVDLTESSQRITDRAKFNQEQLNILDTKNAKFIILLTGDSSLALGQTIDISYEFDKLELFGGYSLN